MDKKSYYLVRFDTLNPEEDFQMIVSFLSSVPGITISSEKDQVFITYPKAKQQAILKKTTVTPNLPTPSSMMIQCDGSDYTTLQIFRQIAPRVKYRIYNPTLGCFLPRNLNLFPISEVILPEKVTETFRVKGYQPLFNYYKSNIYYAKPLGQQSVHLINPPLLSYFVDFKIDESPIPEFSYEVAPNLEDFVALNDQDLIPPSFYLCFQKSLKIINLSGFDIERITRKVFIKPWFFLYDKTKQEYFLMTAEKSALHFADKVRPGETLDTTIKRILREEVKMADDYVRAKVTKIEFDRDKENKLTPRLWVSIYLKEIKNKEKIEEKAQRGWTSLKSEAN